MSDLEGELTDFATIRTDVLEYGIHEDDVLMAGRATRPHQAAKILGISEDELLQVVKAGLIGRPAKWGGRRVAWRRDEIVSAMERVRDWLDERSEP